jgi:two-component system, LuxR family, sensor kinase FixL
VKEDVAENANGGLGESLYRAIVETAVDAIIVIDRAGTIRSVNPAAERVFGYKAAELVRRNVKMLMPEPDAGEHDRYIENYLRTGRKKIIGIGREVVGRRKDGSVFPMELSVGEARQGADSLFVGMVRDISERKAAELALRESELRQRSIVETVPDAIIVIDERGLIQSFSPAAERLFGYSPDEVAGQNVKLLMPSPYREAHDRYVARYLRTGERRIIGIGRVAVGLRRSGETFPMELAIGEFSLGGRHYFTGFVRDLTERQRTEKRIQDLQAELLHVSRLSAMGQMASTLAHELNQPLTAVTNYVQTARSLLASGATGRLDEVLEKTATQALRAGQVIRRLREFVAKGDTERWPENLNTVVEEAIALALVGAKDYAVRVSLDLEAELPPVLIDKVQVQQVVLNLVRNAVEAMKDSPCRELGVATRKRPGLAEVSVADTGPGIAPEIVERLFQPFVTTKATGLGVGLSICREIVEAHGGHLVLDPGSGRGAIFRFTLPLFDQEDSADGD